MIPDFMSFTKLHVFFMVLPKCPITIMLKPQWILRFLNFMFSLNLHFIFLVLAMKIYVVRCFAVRFSEIFEATGFLLCYQFFFKFWFVRLLALRPLLAYCASLG
jgi:hypothetical protein